MAKVSIVMGVYNCKSKAYLYRSVNSIICQSFKDWELLIVDDGSTDQTLSLLYKVAALDNRIRILSYKQNHGLAYALNYGIANADSEYIARMDDDDISRSDRLEKQIEFLDAHREYGFVGSIANVFNDNGIWGILKMPEKPCVKDFLWNIPFIHPSMVFRKEAFEVCCYSTDEINRRCEDYTLVMDLYSKGVIGYNIQETLLDYYIANDSKKYRPMKDRVKEAIARYRGYKMNGILLLGLPYIIKPIIIGFIPQCLFKKIKEVQYKNRRM